MSNMPTRQSPSLTHLQTSWPAFSEHVPFFCGVPGKLWFQQMQELLLLLFGSVRSTELLFRRCLAGEVGPSRRSGATGSVVVSEHQEPMRRSRVHLLCQMQLSWCVARCSLQPCRPNDTYPVGPRPAGHVSTFIKKCIIARLTRSRNC